MRGQSMDRRTKLCQESYRKWTAPRKECGLQNSLALLLSVLNNTSTYLIVLVVVHSGALDFEIPLHPGLEDAAEFVQISGHVDWNDAGIRGQNLSL